MHALALDILAATSYEPTPSQQRVAEGLATFFSQQEARVFVLNGYAGTGKTTMLAALRKVLDRGGRQVVMMAPTGRAAKVMASGAGTFASTIHRLIYKADPDTGTFILRQSKYKDTLFIVDEASMVGEGGGMSGNLLDDLFSFVFGGKDCRLLLSGDLAQLPPVGTEVSPALHPAYLRQRFSEGVMTGVLDDVVRQQQESGILMNATRLRNQIRRKVEGVPQLTADYPDVIRVSGYELQDHLEDAYSQYGAESTMFICRSNKRAYLFNQQIRTRIRWQEDILSAGERLMCVKNNYFWLDNKHALSFIANGDMMQIDRVGSREERWGCNFAHVSLTLTDHPDEPSLDGVLLTDTLDAESAGLPREKQEYLYRSGLEHYQQENGNAYMKLRKDPFFNALQVKYAYAVTCHKSQGGQWPAVFIDAGFLRKEDLGLSYLRWLYTAMTRAVERVYLVNFPDQFFEPVP